MRFARVVKVLMIGAVAALPATAQVPSIQLGDPPIAGQMTFYGGDEQQLSVGVPVAAGDFDGDGFLDSASSRMVADVSDIVPLRSRAGIVSVGFGNGVLAGAVDFASPSSRTSTILGAKAGDSAGSEIWAGDLNGDGVDDLIVGAQDTDGPTGVRGGAGSIYVLFGRDAFPALIDLASPPAFVTQIHGAGSGDRLGIWMRADDLDGDGIDDLLVGADGADGPANARLNCGSAYLIRGATTWPSMIDLLFPPADAVLFHGVDPNDRYGSTLNIGDVNGDGRNDVLLGAGLNRAGAGLGGGPGSGAGDGPANNRNNAGECAVLFHPGDWPSEIDLAAPPSSVSMTVVYGAASGDYLGEEIVAGDLNLDGVDELILGALTASPAFRSLAGLGVVLPGGKHLENRLIDLASPPGDLAITVILGAAGGDIMADTMLTADVDADGFPDLLMGSPLADSLSAGDIGRLDVLFGRPEPFPSVVDLRSPPHTVRLASVIGPESGDILGYSLDAGDWDGDGFADPMPNAMGADGQNDLINQAGDVQIISGALLASIAPTFTITPTPTVTPTPTRTFTPTQTRTSTLTPTVTETFTVTETPTVTLTLTASETSSQTRTETPTESGTPTHTPTETETSTPTPTITPSPSVSPTGTVTTTESPTSTSSATPSVTETAEVGETPTASSSPTDSPTATVSPTSSPTETFPDTNTPTPSPSMTHTATRSTTPTWTRSADFDGNGRVDAIDLMLLLEQWTRE